MNKKSTFVLILLAASMILMFVPQNRAATAMTVIPKSTYFKYRSPAGLAYNLSLDLTITANSTANYKVAYNYTAYLGSSLTGNGTIYINKANRTIVSHINGSGSIDLFPNGTESIIFIEPKLKKTATFDGNLPHCSYLTEGIYTIYKLADFVNPLMTNGTFDNAMWGHNVSSAYNQTGQNESNYYVIQSIWEQETGINLYREVYMEDFWLELFLSETNFEFPAEAVAEKKLDYTILAYIIILCMAGLLILARGASAKR